MTIQCTHHGDDAQGDAPGGHGRTSEPPGSVGDLRASYLAGDHGQDGPDEWDDGD